MVTEEEFDAFYAASYSRLVGQLYAMTGDWAEAQDVVQEAFIRAWDRRAAFELSAAPESWIRTVAWRLAVSRLRRLRRGAELLRRHRVEERVAEAGVEHPMLVQALRGLTEHQRRAVVLHHMCDLSIEDVAAETGSTVDAVKSRLARGRAALASALGGSADGGGEYAVVAAATAVRAAAAAATGRREGRTGVRGRRRARHGATAAGSGALAVAGVFLMVLVFAGHGGPAVVSPAGTAPTAATSPAAPSATATGQGGKRGQSSAAASPASPGATASASSSPTGGNADVVPTSADRTAGAGGASPSADG